MAKRMKRERGYYRELKQELKAVNQGSMKRPKVLEFWLKHTNDPLKDVHFYVNWANGTHVIEAWDYMAKVSKDEEYEDDTLLRYLDTPTTRKQKAIYKSQMHGIPHLSEIGR